MPSGELARLEENQLGFRVMRRSTLLSTEESRMLNLFLKIAVPE